jgi:hypothetical protein
MVIVVAQGMGWNVLAATIELDNLCLGWQANVVCNPADELHTAQAYQLTFLGSVADKDEADNVSSSAHSGSEYISRRTSTKSGKMRDTARWRFRSSSRTTD